MCSDITSPCSCCNEGGTISLATFSVELWAERSLGGGESGSSTSATSNLLTGREDVAAVRGKGQVGAYDTGHTAPVLLVLLVAELERVAVSCVGEGEK